MNLAPSSPLTVGPTLVGMESPALVPKLDPLDVQRRAQGGIIAV